MIGLLGIFTIPLFFDFAYRQSNLQFSPGGIFGKCFQKSARFVINSTSNMEVSYMLFKKNFEKNLVRNDPVFANIHIRDNNVRSIVRGTSKDRDIDYICINFDNGIEIYVNGDTALVLRKLLDDACDDMCKIIESCDGDNSQDLPKFLQVYKLNE